MIHATATITATTRTIADLAERVAADGITAHHDAVVRAVHAAGLADRFPVLTDVVIDGNAPPVARERAIGRLAALVSAPAGRCSAATTRTWRGHAA